MTSMANKILLNENILDTLNRKPLGPLLVTSATDASGGSESLARDSWSGLHLPPICQSSKTQVQTSVDVAKRAFERGGWRQLPKRKRRAMLLEWAALIESNSARLAYLNCLETGRSLHSLQQDSLPKAIQVLRWFAEILDKLDDRSVHTGEYGLDFALVRREALGVVAAILPWNDPMVTLMWKVAPALAMGNAVIVKPSEYATLVVGEALSLAHQAGIQNEYLQMLTGDGRVGSLLVRQRGVDKIAFTGSSRTAARIGLESHRAGLKRLSFECGGKGAFIFGSEGRDPEEFARIVAQNMFYNQGQICSAPSIIHVPQALADRITVDICTAASAFAPQDPMAGQVGFMVSKTAVAKMRANLVSLDDDIFMGKTNDRTTPPKHAEWSMTPTVLRGLPDGHAFWDTELFAPVLLVRPYASIDEAITHANASKYGLASGIWSQDIDECISIAGKLRVGNVHINSWGDDPNQVPFGGVKESGHGREKAIDALDAYSQVKSIFFRPRSAN